MGKRTLALQFARALSCQRSGPGETCDSDECRACRLIPQGTFPDLDELASIKIDEARDLQRRVALAPYEAPWRIAVLPDFHLATHNAANAMLKTLEEPPDHVVLLLTAISVESLLPTVVSRCEVLPLRTVPKETITNALMEQGTELGQAEFLASLAAGRPGRAIKFATEDALLEKRAEALEGLITLLQRDVGDRFGSTDQFIGRGKLPDQRRRLKMTLEDWLSAWRDLLYLGYEAQVEPRNPDIHAALAAAARDILPSERYRAVGAIARTLAAIEHNANLRLAFETLMLDLPRLR